MAGDPVRDEFTVHRLNKEGMENAKKLAAKFSETLNQVEQITGAEGRSVALMRTYMELASFYAKKAMAQKSENQDV